jgi:hypothetical protein
MRQALVDGLARGEFVRGSCCAEMEDLIQGVEELLTDLEESLRIARVIAPWRVSAN